MNKHSLKIKVTTWITLLCIVLTVVIGAITYFTGGLVADADVRSMLKAEVLAEVDRVDGLAALPDSVGGTGSVCLFITDLDGNVLLGTPMDDTSELPTPDSKNFFDIKVAGQKAFLYDKKIDIGTEKLFVRGISLAPDKATVYRDILTCALYMLPVYALLLALICYLVVHRATLGLEKLISATSVIADGRDLDRTIPYPKQRDEVFELTETINTMLTRLSESFASEKQFMENIGTDLEAPASAILAECDAIDAIAKATPRQAEKLAAVRRQAERMLRIIGEFREYSEIESGTIEQVFETADVTKLVEDVCNAQRSLYGDAVKLEYTCDEQHIIAKVNPTLLSQLVENLISNAYQYTENGGLIEVSITEAQGVDLRPTFVISVKDNGIGIPKDAQSKIWERYYHVGGARSDYGCSGLGLPIVKWIATYHSGSVRLISDSDKGSEFIVELPQSQK